MERFDCVVVADVCYDRVAGWGPIVCVGHGTISKGIFFTDHPSTRRENFARVLCVPGPWYAQSFGNQVFTRVVPTGFSKMDDLAETPPDHRSELLRSLGLDPAKRTILFAPTFNRELTSLAILFKTWASIDPDEYQVLFKLHGATDEHWKRRYRELAARSPNLRFVEASSLSPYMLACDVIISDVSSAYVEALATGTPVIVVNNPAMTTYPWFNAGDVEYVVRDGAYQVHNGDELLATLAELKVHDPLAARRADWTRRLFAPLDGRSSARIADQIVEVAAGHVPHRLPGRDDAMAVLLADGLTGDRLDVVAANLSRAASSLKLFRRGPGPTAIAGLPVHELRAGRLPPEPFIRMTGAFAFPDDWDLLWFMASHFSPGVKGVFGPVLPDRDQSGAQRHARYFSKRPALPDAALQNYYKYTSFGQLSASPSLLDDGLIFSRGVPRDIAARWLDHLGDPEALATITTQLTDRQMFVGVVPAFFAVDPPAAAARP